MDFTTDKANDMQHQNSASTRDPSHRPSTGDEYDSASNDLRELWYHRQAHIKYRRRLKYTVGIAVVLFLLVVTAATKWCTEQDFAGHLVRL